MKLTNNQLLRIGAFLFFACLFAGIYLALQFLETNKIP